MASADTDKMLREMASVRGFRLVKSRRRKPGGDFGRYGLADAKSGKACFGIGEQGLKASAKEIENFLRGRAQSDWKSSLSAPEAEPEPPRRRAARPPRPPEREPPPHKRQARPPEREAPRRQPEREPPPRRREARRQKETRPPELQLPLLAAIKPSKQATPEPKPKPAPQLVIREAKAKDAAEIAALIEDREPPSTRRIAATIAMLAKQGTPVMVAEQDGIVGAVSVDVMMPLHHAKPLGRITFIVTAKAARRKGIGGKLLEQAEARLRSIGCGTIELVNPIEVSNANHFLRGKGYQRSGYRFAKQVDD